MKQVSPGTQVIGNDSFGALAVADEAFVDAGLSAAAAGGIAAAGAKPTAAASRTRTIAAGLDRGCGWRLTARHLVTFGVTRNVSSPGYHTAHWLRDRLPIRV